MYLERRLGTSRKEFPVRLVRFSILATLVGLILAGLPGAAAFAGAPAPLVTYSATVTVPAPPASSFAGAGGGGDGWAVALSATQLFNVFHHSSTLSVNCHNQSDASACWSAPKTITDANGNNFSTSIGPGLFLDQGTGLLYVDVVRTSDNTAGIACIDTTQPPTATASALFCGFTALSAAGGAASGNANGLSAPVQVGSKWYIYNETSNAPATLLCFDLDAKAACPFQPYAVDTGGVTFTSIGYSYPIGAAGSQVILQVVGNTSDELACFNTANNGSCGGSWPVTVTAAAGGPYPLLDGSGNVLGICDPISGNPCFDLTGASTPSPAGLDAAIGATVNYNGPPLTIGPRVYVPNAFLNQVGCYDYNLGSACQGFPKILTNLDLLYTVNPDPYRPTCIWVNADSGTAQIQNFDAYTGGPCGAGPIRVLASSFVVPLNACIPTSYTSLQVLSPSRASYATGTVVFEDASGNVIPGTVTQTLDATGSTSLTGLSLPPKDALPQFLISLNSPSSPISQVEVKLTWMGPYSAACAGPGITVTGLPTTQPPPTSGYWTVARDGGIFAFGDAGFYGSMGGAHLNAPITGMAATPDGGGYWLVARDGGIFAFGDAGFYGSMGGGHLNAPITGMAATPDGKGYWLVGTDGGVFAFGDATPHGSMGGAHLNAPITGMAVTPDGKGYWLVGTDGGIFAFGDAAPHGSMGGGHLNAPITGMAATPDGGGYWLVGTDGGIFAFGDAGFHGSMGGTPLNAPVTGIASTPNGGGYWMVATDGGIFAFPDAGFFGSMGGLALNAPMVGMATFP